MARRRSSLNVFGLSMLDTITCGLGGSIVLLLILSSMAEPSVSVAFEQRTDSGAVDSGNDGPDGKTRDTPIALAAVFFNFDEPVNWTVQEPTVTACNGNSKLPAVHATLQGGSAAGLSGKATRWKGVVIWFDGTHSRQAPSCIQVSVLSADPPKVLGCSISMAGDAHALFGERRTRCPLSFQLLRPNDLYRLGS